MKVVVPIRSVRETDILIDDGADELFCGIVPPEWKRRFGFESPLNRRETATGNLASYADLQEIVAGAHDRGVDVHVTLNAHCYAQEHYQVLPSVLGRLARLDVDGVIVADPGLLFLIKKMRLPFRVVVSGEAMATTAAAVALWRTYNAARVILPRQVTPTEMGRITRPFADMEFEAFVFSDDCFFEGGVCNTIHHFSSDTFCHEFLQRAEGWGRMRGMGDLVGRGLTLDYFLRMKRTACGICSLGTLKKNGITHLKIPGRTGPLESRRAGIRLVRDAVTLIRAGRAGEKMIAQMTQWRQAVEEAAGGRDAAEAQRLACLLGNSCYYPDDPVLKKKRRDDFGPPRRKKRGALR